MADEVQIKNAIEYPKWKIVAWRFLRTSIAGGCSALIAVSIVLKPDFSNVKEYGFALLAAFIAGFIAALGKVVRDLWGNDTKSGVIDKIVI